MKFGSADFVLRGAALVLLLAAACANRVDVPPPPPVVAPPPPPPSRIVIEPPAAPVWMEKGDYQRGFLSGASRYFSGRRTSVTATSSGAPAHDIVTVKRVGRDRTFVVFTSGLGRVGRSAKNLPDDHRHVEFVAYAPKVGPGIGEVLSALGAAIFDGAAAWKAYDHVSLDRPVRGLKHFDLLPGGEVDVPNGPRVTLLKVVPLSADEFERAKSESGSQWVDSRSADPAGQERDDSRWLPALSGR